MAALPALQRITQGLLDLNLEPRDRVVPLSALDDSNDAVPRIMAFVKDRDLSKPDERAAFEKILRTKFDIKVRYDEKMSMQIENINQIIGCITDMDLQKRLLGLLVDIERFRDISQSLPNLKESLFSLMSPSLKAYQKACIRKFFTLFETNADQLTLVSGPMNEVVNSYLARLCSNFFDRSGTYDLSATMDPHSVQMLVNFITHEEVPKHLCNQFEFLLLAKDIKSTSMNRHCREQIRKDSFTSSVSQLFDLFSFAQNNEIDDLYLVSLIELAKKSKDDVDKGNCRFDARAQILLRGFRESTFSLLVYDGLLTLQIRHADPKILDLISLTNVECLDFSECHRTVRSAIDWIVRGLLAPNCTITKLNLRSECVGRQILETEDYGKLASALAHTKSLTELDLSHMRITSSDFTLLFSSIGNEYSLRSLTIENHYLNDIFAFREVTEKLWRLKKFNMKSSQLVVQKHFDFRRAFNNLKELEFFSIADLDDYKLLIGNSTLHTLELAFFVDPTTYRTALSKSIAQNRFIKKCIINSPYNNFNFEFIRAILLNNYTTEITLHTGSVDEKLRVLAENCTKFTIVYDIYR